jgi:hypothetical protein
MFSQVEPSTRKPISVDFGQFGFISRSDFRVTRTRTR